jgi:O-antigen/teichoic acid export membrane protein
VNPLTSTGRRATGALIQNTMWLAGGRVAGQLMSVVLTVVLARGLGTAGFGQYAFVGAIVVIGNVVTTFGTESLLVREIAGGRGDATRLLATALWLQLVLSAAFVLMVFAGAGWLPNRTGEVVWALRIYTLCLFPLAFASVFSAALRGWERLDFAAILGVGTAALQTVAALIAMRAGAHLPVLMLSLVFAQVLAAAFGWLLCRIAQTGFRLGVSTVPASLVVLFKRVWPFAVLAGLTILSQRIGVLLLALLAGDASAGWFAAAARVVEGLKLTHYAFLGALLPLASRAGADGQYPANEWLVGLVRKSRLVLLGLGMAAALAASALASPLVSLLYGAEYHAAVTALRILAWTLLPYAAAAPTALALVSTGHERVVLRAGGVGLVITTGLGVWLVPQMEVNGACAAVLAGEIARSALLLLAGGRIATPRFAADEQWL